MTDVRDGRSYRLCAPPLPLNCVRRARLTDRVLATEPGGTCLISSAPGYGATTVLAQAVDRTSDRVCWVSLEGPVDDAAACELLAASVGASAERLDVNELLEAVNGPALWLIVDGLSPLEHPRLTEYVTVMSGRLPRTARLAVSSHSRLSGMARAERLAEADLRFDDDEAMQLLQGLDPHLAIDQTSAIVDVAEGWGSALVAGARHPRHGLGPRWLLEEGAASLLGDWFAGLPEKHRRFLLSTAVLDLLSAGVAEAVCQDPDAPQVLLALDASHAYLLAADAPPGHAGRWWRRHGLLTAFLQMRLNADSVKQHSLAADWFIEKGDIDSAMHHLIGAGRTADAGELLTRHESGLMSGGRAQQVLDWYGQISPSADNTNLHLLRIGWGQVLTGDVRGSDATLARLQVELTAQRRADLQTGDAGPGLGPGDPWDAEAALLTAYLAACHADPATMVSAGRRAMNAPIGVRTRDANQLAPLVVMRGHLWSGQTQAAADVLRVIEEMQFDNDVMRESQRNGLIALLELEQGKVRRARTRIAASLSWLERAGLDPLALGHFSPLQGDATLSLESGGLDVAIDKARAVIDRAHVAGHQGEVVWASVTVARAELLLGDFGAALRTLNRAAELAVTQNPETTMTTVIHRVQALTHVASGDLVRADRIIRHMPPSDERALLWARASLARQPGQARRALDSVSGNAPRTQAQKHLLLAAVHRTSSRRMAQGHLRRAAQLAHEFGMAQLLNPPIPGMLDFATETALEEQDDNLRWLLRSRSAEARDTPADTWSASLSRGELQLVALLPSRTKNAEIAAMLGVSINTVKTRLRRLYAKLGASNRDEAIIRARARGLIE